MLLSYTELFTEEMHYDVLAHIAHFSFPTNPKAFNTKSVTFWYMHWNGVITRIGSLVEKPNVINTIFTYSLILNLRGIQY